MKTCLTVIPILLLGVALTLPASAQLTIIQQGVTDPSRLGETVTLDSEGLGQRVTQRLFLQFDPGLGDSLSLRSVRLAGPGASQFAFEIKGVTGLPVAIRNELRMDVFVSYLPTAPGPAQATLEFTLRTERSDLLPTDAVFTANLIGRVPAYALTYIAPGAGRVNVSPAGTIRLGHKPTGTPTHTALILTNVGSVNGVVESFQVSGTNAFRVVDPPPFPTRLAPGGTVGLQLVFQPDSTIAYSGELSFVARGGATWRYSLTGQGGDLFRFQLVSYAAGSNAGRSEQVQSGTPIVFNQAAAAVQVVAENARQSAQLVESIRVSGPFTVTRAPSLPSSVMPGASIAVMLEPSSAASSQRGGELIIGDAVFPLMLDAPTLPVVRFSASGGDLRAGERAPVGLSLAQPYPVDIHGTLRLSLESPEADPAASLRWSSGGAVASFEIPAGQTAAVFAGNQRTIEFQAGVVAGVAVVSAGFTAGPWGIDITPPSPPQLRYAVNVAKLPAVTFSETAGPLQAGRDLALGLSLAAAYPEDIAGTLQLSFVSADVAQPAGPWAGARQVPFQIAAGATMAMFGSRSSTEFTAPTMPGELSVTARFATAAAAADITPDPAPELVFDVQVVPLPEVSFSQAGGTVAAAAQVPLQVSIAEPYPNDIVGSLTLAFETRTFASDPAVQWASGGNQAHFAILAGTTSAIFPGQATSNAFQTGTVAGEIVLTAQFFSVPNGYAQTRIQQAATAAAEITPDKRPELRFNVMEAAPVLQRVSLGGTGQGGFNLQVTGYSTPRAVDSLSFAFTARSGTSLSTKSIAVGVAEYFRTYFGSNQSAASGSQFTATVNFNMDEGAYEDLRTVSVTATNSVGTSSPVSLDLN